MLKSLTLEVVGDHKLVCVSCEHRVKQALKSLPGVDRIRAHARKQRIEVLFNAVTLDPSAIAQRLATAGYQTQIARPAADPGLPRANGSSDQAVRIQLLYFPGCPNVAAARDALTRALRASGLPPQFEEIDVTAPGTPAPLRGWGSPTILLDGVDIGGATAPTGLTCRLYSGDCCSSATGAPSESLIREALERVRAPRRGWLRGLAAVPAAVLPLLPSFTCPACLAAYAGVLSSLGLGFLLNDRIQRPLIAAFLVLTVASVAWTTRKHRNVWPLVAALAGSLAVVAGRLVWSAPPLVYVGVGALLVGAIWNLGLKRRGPRVALGLPSEKSVNA